VIAYGPIRMKSPWVLLKSVIFLEFPSHYHRLKPKTKYSSPILTILTIGVAAARGGGAAWKRKFTVIHADARFHFSVVKLIRSWRHVSVNTEHFFLGL